MARNQPSKLAFSRIIEIDRQLRSRSLPTLDELSREFGVSRRTVERDIESMRDYFDAPIEYDRNKKTYKYMNPNFSLPSITLSDKELFSILIAERALRQYSGTPFEPVVHQAFNKLVSLLPGGKGLSVDMKDLCSAIVFESEPPVTEYTPEVFSTLLDAISKEQRVEMTYYTMSRDKENVRQVDPYHIACWGGDWYLIAFCCNHREIRNFHLARIHEAKLVDHYFSRPSDFDPKKYMADGFGHMTGKNKVKVKVRVHPPASRWVKEKIWHPSQVITEHKDGSLEISMEVSAFDAIKRFVMQFGAQAELLEPKEMRKEMKNETAKMHSKYS